MTIAHFSISDIKISTPTPSLWWSLEGSLGTFSAFKDPKRNLGRASSNCASLKPFTKTVKETVTVSIQSFKACDYESF